MKFWERRDATERIVVTNAEIVINHTLKFAYIYHQDPGLPDDSFDELEAHLRRRGYLLYVSTAPRESTLPVLPVPNGRARI